MGVHLSALNTHEGLLRLIQDSQNGGQVDLSFLGQAEQALQIDHGARPYALQLAFAFAPVARVTDAVVSQFGNLALDFAAGRVEDFELLSLLLRACLLQLRLVGVGGDAASRALATHTCLEQGAGGTYAAGKGEFENVTPLPIPRWLARHAVPLRTGDGLVTKSMAKADLSMSGSAGRLKGTTKSTG
jgi:hypothetical protein